MRRLIHLSLVCALIALLPASTALAATSHTTTTAQRHHTHRHTHHRARHRTTSATHHRRTRHHHVVSTVPVGGKATTAQARAIINDCQSHGQLTHSYTRAELEKAKATLTAYNKQYSNCSTVIEDALLHKATLGKGSGGSGGSGTTIIIIVAAVLIVLAALLGGLALRRRRGPDGPARAA